MTLHSEFRNRKTQMLNLVMLKDKFLSAKLFLLGKNVWLNIFERCLIFIL